LQRCSKYQWVVEGSIAVSGMPCAESLQEIAETFKSIVSLSTWVEHASRGYDPRLVEGLDVEFIWIPVGEYNAPSLPKLVKSLQKVKEPVLIHSYTMCGRTAVYTAALLMSRLGLRLPEALAQLSSKANCSVETLPQLSVLKAYDYALRFGLEKWVASLNDDDARGEYLLLFSRELGVKPETNGTLWRASEMAYNKADYTIAGVVFDGGRRLLKIICWVEREAHPRSAKRVGCPSSLANILERELKEYDVTVVVENLDRFNIPWI
jgi:protein tyrosine phosphatase (PTP) superfamily phosphohydrolase (DUF442 family)